MTIATGQQEISAGHPQFIFPTPRPRPDRTPAAPPPASTSPVHRAPEVGAIRRRHISVLFGADWGSAARSSIPPPVFAAAR
jgi:hypothetical protein